VQAANPPLVAKPAVAGGLVSHAVLVFAFGIGGALGQAALSAVQMLVTTEGPPDLAWGNATTSFTLLFDLLIAVGFCGYKWVGSGKQGRQFAVWYALASVTVAIFTFAMYAQMGRVEAASATVAATAQGSATDIVHALSSMVVITLLLTALTGALAWFLAERAIAGPAPFTHGLAAFLALVRLWLPIKFMMKLSSGGTVTENATKSSVDLWTLADSAFYLALAVLFAVLIRQVRTRRPPPA
jgi:hypothetical protein